MLYENAWPSHYEEIKTWYPVWYREVLEMDALWKVWGGQLDAMRAGIIQAVDNNFIDYADAQTITKLEEALGIVHDGPRTLVERRNIIKAFIIGSGKIGQQEIKQLISVFTPGLVDVEFANGVIDIHVTREFGDAFNLYDIHLVLDNRIPVHLALGITDEILPLRVVTRNRFIFRDLSMEFRVRNPSTGMDGYPLDGSKILDGTWLLGPIGKGGPVFIDFGVKSSLDNTANIMGARSFTVAVFPIKNDTFGFSGTITRSRIWRLDGAHNLDGTYNLGEIMVKEDL